MGRLSPSAATVAAFVEREGLLPDGATVLVAVSGGADSLALLGILDELAPSRGWQLIVATLDHGWSDWGATACDAVEALTAPLGWPVERDTLIDVPAREAPARAARLDLLRTRAEAHGAAAVALGHTADDRVETMLLNLLRGAGVTGLGAMGARTGPLIRPLLPLTRQETRRYVADRGWTPQEDPSNASRRYDRNRLRLDLVPGLRAFRPGAAAALRRAAAGLGDERAALDRYAALLLQPRWMVAPAAQALGGLPAGVLDLAGWTDLPSPERALVLRAFVERVAGHRENLDRAALARLDALASGPADAGRQTLGTLQFGRSGPRLVLLAAALPDWASLDLPATGTVAVAPVGLEITVGGPPLPPEDLAAGPLSRGAPHRLPDTTLSAGLRESHSLAIRPVRPGDRLRPAGRGGSRKVSDLLWELGVPALVRQRVPLVVCGDDPIWLPGLAPTEGWAGPQRVTVRYGGPTPPDFQSV